MAEVYDSVFRAAAVIAGAQIEMDAAAEDVRQAIVDAATPHRKTGAFIDSIRVTKVGMDRVIYSDDPAAFAMEYGAETRDGHHMEAQGNFTKAVRKWRR